MAEAADSRPAQWGFESLQGYLSTPERVWAYSHALGCYLGDGCISRTSRTFRLRLFQDARYRATAEEWAASLRVLFPDNRVHIGSAGRGRGCDVVGVYSNLLPLLFPQHGPGPKHERSLTLTDAQERVVRPRPLLRGLLHSDGCRYTETRPGRGKTYSYVMYAFTNKSEDLHAIVGAAAARLSLRPTRTGTKNTFFRRRADVQALDAFVGPKL